jgi:dTMP kinase
MAMDELNVLRGKFITFEGIEGAGKSTQSKLFVEYLNKNDVEAVWTREPGGCPEAEEIRNVLISGGAGKLDGITELLLMYAARRLHTERRIKPLLKDGVTVISDRYLDSSLAYQGFGRSLGEDKVSKLKEIVLGDFTTDLTIILDLPVEIGLQRANKRGETNRFEEEEIEFHRKVRGGFDYIYRNNMDRCVKIDVMGKNVDELTKIMIDTAVKFFKKPPKT